MLCLYHPQTYMFHCHFRLHLENGSCKVESSEFWGSDTKGSNHRLFWALGHMLAHKATLLEAEEKRLPKECRLVYLLERWPVSRSAFLVSSGFCPRETSPGSVFLLGQPALWAQERELDGGRASSVEGGNCFARSQSTLEWDMCNFIFCFQCWELDLSVVGKQTVLNKTEELWHSHLHLCPRTPRKAW